MKDGRFLPDSTRSGRFPGEVQGQEAALDEDQDLSSSSSEGSEDESEEDFEEEERSIKSVVGRWDPRGAPSDPDALRYARHKISRCIHMVEDESGMALRCGRRLGSSYMTLLERPAFLHPLCSTCFRQP